MSSEKKITRHTIDHNEPPPFFFLGVVSSEPDYRLSVMINRHLGTDLHRCSEEITVRTAAGTGVFPRFASEERRFTLVSNRNAGNVLLRKLKNIDYLIVPCGQHERKEAEELGASLRMIQEITAVFIFDSRETADKNLSLLAL